MEIERKTIFNDEEYLRQISTPVDFQNDDYLKYIAELKSYCATHTCYALAPVQIGIPKRLIYIKNTKEDMKNNGDSNYDESIIYINPSIIKASGHTKFLEGCESCIYKEDGTNIYLVDVVDRPYLLEIEYYDINGNKKYKTLEGFETTVFSHEYDHLDGILHMDRSKEIFKMSLDEMKTYRANHPYEVLSTTDDYENHLI